MSRIKAGLELAVELKEEELAEIESEPTAETVEEFHEESLEDTLAEIDESFELAVKDLWSDFKRDFLGKEPRGGTAAETFRLLAQKYARTSAEAKDAHDMDSALKYRDLSWYYSLMSGNPPAHIRDADQFKYDMEKKYSTEIKSNLQKARVNELKEPDYSDDDSEEYLKKLTPKKVKKDYEKSLPKGHKSLAKKYNLEEDEDDGNLYTFRVLCTLKDYGHTMVSKRGEDIMKTVRVTAATSNEAINKAKRFYKLKGYKVMDAEAVEKLPASGDQVNEVSDELIDRYRVGKNKQLSDILGKAKGDMDARVFDKDDVNTVKKRMRGTDLDLSRNRRQMKMSEADLTLKNHPWTGADVEVKATGQKGVVMYVSKQHTFSSMVPFVRIYKVKLDDGTLKSFRLKDLRKIGSPNSGEQVNEQDIVNPKDKVTLDIPLLIRLLEYAREDAKTDMDLHDLTEKLVALGSESGKTLSMSDYDQLVQYADNNEELAMEAKNPAIHRAKLIAKMEKNAPSFKKAMAKKDQDKEKDKE